jgi:hypothetical protein
MANEWSLEFYGQRPAPIFSLPLQMNLRFLSASEGLGFVDLSGGIEKYAYAGVLLSGSLHLYWAKGMEGQNTVSLRPHMLASYQVTVNHRVYASFEPRFVSQTRASNMYQNQFLSTSSAIRHTDVSNAGEIGLESDWSLWIRSRFSLGVKTVQDLPLFSDITRQGVWITAYGGEITIVIFCAEMFAKLASNDYFASSLLVRSAKESSLDGQVPYMPAVEVECKGSHNFGPAAVASLRLRYVGERSADFTGKSKLPRYVVTDVESAYEVLHGLKISAGIKNLFDVKYEVWRGYQEFPLTLQIALQIRW